MPRRAGRQTKFYRHREALPAFRSQKPTVAPDAGREILTHQVHGLKASDLEERFARALDEAHINYAFQYITGAPKNLPGWRALDFLVERGGAYYPIQVDDTTFVHRGTQGHDKLVETFLMDDMQKQGLHPFHIQRVTDKQLGTQDDANRTVKELFP